MPVRTADAVWEGDLRQGQGTLAFDGYHGPFSFSSRFESGQGTNPEELLAAAHAGCFSMALAHQLSRGGHPPARVHTTAKVHLQKFGEGFQIPKVELITEAEVPGIDESTFRHEAETARASCPVSKLFAGAQITLDARLVTAANAG